MNKEELDKAINDTEEGIKRLIEGIKDHPKEAVRKAFGESLPKILDELERLKKLPQQ
jgi:hypothetical protein